MCTVCFSGLQAVPVAAIAARAWWVKKRNEPSSVVDQGNEERIVTSPEPTIDDPRIATATSR